MKYNQSHLVAACRAVLFSFDDTFRKEGYAAAMKKHVAAKRLARKALNIKPKTPEAA